jgi:hypothetical protein
VRVSSRLAAWVTKPTVPPILLGLVDRLAELGGDDRRQPRLVRRQQRGQPAQRGSALRIGHRGPLPPGPLSRVDGGLDVAEVGVRDLDQHLAGGRILHLAPGAAARPQLAGDQQVDGVGHVLTSADA